MAPSGKGQVRDARDARHSPTETTLSAFCSRRRDKQTAVTRSENWNVEKGRRAPFQITMTGKRRLRGKILN